MARYEQIRICQCAYMLTLDLYAMTKNFNRDFKYTLGEKIKIASHELLDIIRTVNSLPDTEKPGHFPEIDFKKENLRIYVRLAFDSKAISAGQLKIVNEKIEEVGRQLGGWQKWTTEKNKSVV